MKIWILFPSTLQLELLYQVHLDNNLSLYNPITSNPSPHTKYETISWRNPDLMNSYTPSTVLSPSI